MKIKRFRQEHAEGPRGFTRWIQPNMPKYLIACCDCNLVHEMQFKVVGVRKKIVHFRVRRSDGYTAKLRKKN